MAKLSSRAIQRTLEIVDRVKEKYKDQLWKEVYVDRDPETGESIKEMFEKALEVCTNEEERNYFQTALDTGIFNRKEEIPNVEIWQKIDKETNEEILKAVERKELPKLSAIILKKKARKYVRKNNSNSRETKKV